MARFARIDSQIRANRLVLANRFRLPELNPFLRIALRGPLNCESQVSGDSRKSLARYENSFFFCESIRANRFTRIALIRVANRQAI